jgi:hypothetical protein
MAPVKKIIKERHCINVRRCGTSIDELKERNAEKPPPYLTYESYGGHYSRATSYILFTPIGHITIIKFAICPH